MVRFFAGGDWPDRARQAALALTAAAQVRSPIGSLLLDILVFFLVSGLDRTFSRELVESLKVGPERPWLELAKGKELTELRLARQLRPYGVRPRTLRHEDQVGRGYLKEDFAEVFLRYVPRTAFEALKTHWHALFEANQWAAAHRTDPPSGPPLPGSSQDPPGLPPVAPA